MYLEPANSSCLLLVISLVTVLLLLLLVISLVAVLLLLLVISLVAVLLLLLVISLVAVLLLLLLVISLVTLLFGDALPDCLAVGGVHLALPVVASLYVFRSGYHFHHNHIHSPDNCNLPRTYPFPAAAATNPNQIEQALSSPCQ